MTKKVLLRFAISACMLVLIGLVVLALTTRTASSPAVRPLNYYVGSDWIERHPAVARPLNYYVGSDLVERHPAVVRSLNYYVGSDWVERHPAGNP